MNIDKRILNQLNIEDKEKYNINMDYHLHSIKRALDYINAKKIIKIRSGDVETKGLDVMMDDLIKVVKLIKGLKR
jgi:hypothetical protein